MHPSRLLSSLTGLALLSSGALTALPQASAAPRSSPTAVPATAVVTRPGAAVDQGITHDQNPLVPKGASWTEHYFSSARAGSPTPVQLHADVLRPTAAAGRRTPVIVSVGPYFSHAGQTEKETDATGPSQRFADLIEGAKLMSRGYTVVLVDLRGFGGSTGCLDWGGPGEQADVKRSVEWAAKQNWSSGKVGTYGKSYDAWTGLMANNERPRGLAAVIAQEPVWNSYNYLYSNGVARPNNTATPEAYNSIATLAATPGDSARYKANAAYEKAHPSCLSANLANGKKNTSPKDRYWRQRNNVAQAKGSRTPLFFTQGFTESNTKPEQMQSYLANHKGYEHGWMGPWEHVRGNERDPDSGKLAMGRPGFFSEVIRFYDRYLKGVKPAVTDPRFAIQGSDGHWRARESWPGRSTAKTVELGRGRYVDDGGTATASPSTAGSLAAGLARQQVQNSGGQMDRTVRSRIVGTQAGASSASVYLRFSKPITRTTRMTATPTVTLRTAGKGDVQVRLWDVNARTEEAVLINENVARLRGRTTRFELKAMDWQLKGGHRLAVSIGTIDPSGYWRPKPSNRTVTVKAASVALHTQSPRRDKPTAGAASIFLRDYIAENTIGLVRIPKGTFTVPAPRS